MEVVPDYFADSLPTCMPLGPLSETVVKGKVLVVLPPEAAVARCPLALVVGKVLVVLQPEAAVARCPPALVVGKVLVVLQPEAAGARCPPALVVGKVRTPAALVVGKVLGVLPPEAAGARCRPALVVPTPLAEAVGVVESSDFDHAVLGRSHYHSIQQLMSVVPLATVVGLP